MSECEISEYIPKNVQTSDGPVLTFDHILTGDESVGSTILSACFESAISITCIESFESAANRGTLVDQPLTGSA